MDSQRMIAVGIIMDKNNILFCIVICLLAIVIGLLLFENHQIDIIKHTLGIDESAFEEKLHNELGEEDGESELMLEKAKAIV